MNKNLQGQWQFLSELLEGEKLPDSLNDAIYGLREGEMVVIKNTALSEIKYVLNLAMRDLNCSCAAEDEWCVKNQIKAALKALEEQ